MTKTCTKCNEPKELDEFASAHSTKDGLNCRCKSCISAYQKEYREKNREHRLETGREYYQENKEKLIAGQSERAKAQREADPLAYSIKAWKQQGINCTRAEDNQMYNDQEGCCAICKTHQSELKKTLHVDHDHENGALRGLLCRKCNLALGWVGDDLEGVMRFVNYLEKYHD